MICDNLKICLQGVLAGRAMDLCYRLWNMGIAELSSSAQDYLKVIWDLQEWDKGPVQPTAVAERTGMKQSTVSGALGRLVDAGLVTHRPYGKVELTETGRRYAVIMVRRHRLLETFLVQVLGYGWDEVHEEADSLEHAVSDKMVDRIDEYLGHPTADPHGDAIPSADGDLPPMPTTIRPLSDVADGATVRVQRVSDEDPQILRTLSDHNIRPGCLVKIGTRQTNDGFVVSLAGLRFNSELSLKDPLVLSAEHAALIQVSLV